MANGIISRVWRWAVPSRRAKKYAEDRRAKVHTMGKKEGQPLTDFEAGIRSGYLQAQRDSASIYKYKKAFKEAIAAGKSEKQARKIAADAASKPMKKPEK